MGKEGWSQGFGSQLGEGGEGSRHLLRESELISEPYAAPSASWSSAGRLSACVLADIGGL